MIIGIIKKQFIAIAVLLLFIGFFFVQKADAISNASDTLTTARPSAAAPISALAYPGGDQSANQTEVNVVDNGSMYLASDSAVIYPDTGETLDRFYIASMSAQSPLAGPPVNRTIYIPTINGVVGIPHAHHKGDTVVVPIAATHMIEFTPTSGIPANGYTNLVFPTVTNNTIATPSATGFAFNGLSSANAASYINCSPVAACSGGITISGNTIQLKAGGSSVTGAVYIGVGCSGALTVTNGQATCANKSILLNPVKVNTCSTAGTGSPGPTCTADSWKISIQVIDTNGSSVLESTKIIAGTIEAVTVQGFVEPYMTFTIAGWDNGTNLYNQNSSCGTNSTPGTGTDVTNPGIGNGATPYFVNLGGLTNYGINISAQELAVATNAGSGYDIVATSAGHFINPANGYYIADVNGGGTQGGLTGIDLPVPAVFPTAGTVNAFGIHACGPDVTSQWVNGVTGGGAGAKYTNPWNATGNNYFVNIVNTVTLPINTRKTEIEYAATVLSSAPAGFYSTIFTYVASPNF